MLKQQRKKMSIEEFEQEKLKNPFLEEILGMIPKGEK